MNEQVMGKPAAHLNWTSVVPPMRYANVPTVGARYWTAISLASVFGCNLGDFVSLYLHWGHWLGLFPLAVIFAALVVGGIEALRLIGDKLGLEGPFWLAVSALNGNFGLVGYSIVAFFIASWLVSYLHYRANGYDRIEISGTLNGRADA